MALQALGSKITSALQRLVHNDSVDDDAVKVALKEIAGALLEADVNSALGIRNAPYCLATSSVSSPRS
jgi:signal recognition particle GTPase